MLLGKLGGVLRTMLKTGDCGYQDAMGCSYIYEVNGI